MSDRRLLWKRTGNVLGASIPGLDAAMKKMLPITPATADALTELMKTGLADHLEKFKGKPLNTDEVSDALAEAFRIGNMLTKSRRPVTSFVTPDRTGCWS